MLQVLKLGMRVSLMSDNYIIQTAPRFLSTLVGRSQRRKVLPKMLKKLLGVDVLGKGVLRLLGRRVAALEVSDLDTDKNITLGDCIMAIIVCLFIRCTVQVN